MSRRHSAENVPSADNQAELVTLRLGSCDLAGQSSHCVRINAKLPLAHQSLARKLQQDPVEARESHSAWLSLRCNKGGHAFMAQPPCCQLPCSSCSR